MIRKTFLIPLLVLTTLAGIPLAMGQSADDGEFSMNDESYPILSEMNWLDERFLDTQRQFVSDLAYEHYRRKLEDVKNVQELLQKILDDKLVKQDDVKSLQALGVVLGDQFILANHKLKWTMYQDELGESHAICVGSTKHCIFPLSTLARRANIGIDLNVTKVYKKVMDEMAPYLGK